MAKFYNKLYSLLKEERIKAKISKDIAYEFPLTDDEENNIIGDIEDNGYVFTVTALYPWEHRVYALTSDGMDIDLKALISQEKLEKLLDSITNRTKENENSK